MPIRSRFGGFTLIELLVVVAIIGIISIILIPNLLDAINKAKQKRTVADIREIGTAWMSWLTDQVGAASAASQGKLFRASNLNELSYEELFVSLHPNESFFYIQEVPYYDAWLYPMHFGLNSDLFDAAVLIICSQARDQQWQNGGCAGHDHPVNAFVATDYDADIIWGDGYMISWPGQVR